jgi:putative membrane protein
MQTTTDVEETSTKKKRTLKEYGGITLRGICMGAADIVPGVSGGTMAFILGIYEELINSIKTLGDKEFLLAVGTFKVKKVLQLFNWEFLLALALGILIAIVTLAGILESLLHNQPVYVWSFFFGLVLASAFVVSKRIKHWSLGKFGLLLLGALGGYMLVGIVPLQTPDSWWFWMLTGAIVSCALILPGISGAFLLVLLGKYLDVLAAVNGVLAGDLSQLPILIFLALGAAIGLITFSQVLSWLFKRYHDMTVALLIGLMLGSLRKIWPWKQDVEWLLDEVGAYVLDGEGLRVVLTQINIPPDLSTQAGMTQFVFAVVLALVGATAVILLDRVAGQKEEQEAEVVEVDSAATA